MKLAWYGQAAFLIEDDAGQRIICDPYNPELLGFPPIQDNCDVVITSSANDDAHCRHDLVPGEPVWVNALDVALAGGHRRINALDVHAIEAMEMLDHPTHDPDQNAMYRFVVDEMQIVHMGDIGNDLNERQLAFIDGVDVLLALAGGEPVITVDELERVIERCRPRCVIPMHYRTALSRQPGLFELDVFLGRASSMGLAVSTSGVTAELAKADLGEPSQVLVVPQTGA